MRHVYILTFSRYLSRDVFNVLKIVEKCQLQKRRCGCPLIEKKSKQATSFCNKKITLISFYLCLIGRNTHLHSSYIFVLAFNQHLKSEFSESFDNNVIKRKLSANGKKNSY